jgi:hypothetical protein
MADPAIGEVAASVFEKRFGKKPTDVVFNSRALFFLLGKGGFKEKAGGGRLYEFGIEYAENTTHAMQGEMDTLDTTRIQVFDALRYDIKIAAGTVVYSDLEELRAAGGEEKFDLIGGKLENGRNSHIALLNRQCWGLGLGANDIDGLQKLISITPTTGTVGGINRANFSFHRNRQTSGAQTATPFDNLRAALTSTHNQCSLGGTEHKPTGLLWDRATQEGYESTLVTLERFDRDDRKNNGDATFMNEGLKVKGVPGFYDEDAPSGEARWINSKFMKFAYHRWMHMDPAVDPANQLSNVHKLSTFGNLCLTGSRHTGVVSAIS